MDYQEAIESHINECRHRIYVIRNHVNANGDADKDVCNKNIDVLKIAISAMQELQEYKKLGTLEEVQDAVERQKALEPSPMLGIYGKIYECKECGNELEMYIEYCPFCGQKQKWGEKNEQRYFHPIHKRNE